MRPRCHSRSFAFIRGHNDMSDWAKKIAAGDLRALARAATAIENHEPGARAVARRAARASRQAGRWCSASRGRRARARARWSIAWRPHSGRQGKTVAIIAVDPSSA